MPDRDPHQHQGHPSDAAGEYRPFNDPKHPSWYTDASTPAAPSAPVAGQGTAASNPYADQPLSGPYGNGQAQYPINGQYPVRTNPPGQSGGYGVPAQPGLSAPYGRQVGTPFPTQRQGPPASGMAIAAMVLGIIGIVTGGILVIPQILAVVLGHLGLKDPRGKGFALAGLIMGYLVMGLWVLGLISLFSLAASFS
jgi:Domain of unknown function (DUF4190)